MSPEEKIDSDLKNAMLAQDTELVSVLRLLKNAMKNAQIEKMHELSEVEQLSVLEKQAKQRKDSIVQFEAGARQDLVAKEKAELDIISRYLPEKMDEEDLKVLISRVITELDAHTMADMGKVMKEVMAQAAGKADATLVSAIVKEKLS